MIPPIAQVESSLERPETFREVVRFLTHSGDARSSAKRLQRILTRLPEFGGLSAAIEFLGEWPLDAGTIRFCLELLENAQWPSEYKTWLREIVGNAPTTVLETCGQELQACGALGIATRARIAFRLRLAGWDPGELWRVLCRECRKLDEPASEEWIVIDEHSVERLADDCRIELFPSGPKRDSIASPEISALEDLCRAVAGHPQLDAGEILRVLEGDPAEVGRNLCATCILIAGLARLQGAVPALVALMESSDRDLVRLVPLALARIGDSAAVGAMESRFGVECGHFEVAAVEALSRLPCDETEQTVLRLLDRAREPRLQSKLCDVLLRIFSSEAEARVRQQLQVGIEDPFRLTHELQVCQTVHGAPPTARELQELQQSAMTAPLV